jgi:LAO/AO transport system kinase
MELADLVVINKADIDPDAATRARAQITSALRLIGQQGRPEHAHASPWQAQVIQLSALKSQGLDGFWQQVSRFRDLQSASGRLAQRRKQQAKAWMWERIDAGLRSAFRQHAAVRAALPSVLQQVGEGRLIASVAARRLLGAMGLGAAVSEAGP